MANDATTHLLQHAEWVQQHLVHLEQRISALESPRTDARWRGGACNGCLHSIIQHMAGDRPPQIVCRLTHDRWVCNDAKLAPPEACSAREKLTPGQSTGSG